MIRTLNSMSLIFMELEEKIKKIVDELSKLRFTLAVYLFGSYAQGKATPISDIDLCVIDDTSFPREEREEAYCYTSTDDKIRVSLFSQLPLYIQFEVLKGIPLFIRDKEKIVAFKEKVLQEYQDQSWLWEMHFRIRKKLGKWSIG